MGRWLGNGSGDRMAVMAGWGGGGMGVVVRWRCWCDGGGFTDDGWRAGGRCRPSSCGLKCVCYDLEVSG